MREPHRLRIRRDKLLTLPNNELVRTYSFNHAAALDYLRRAENEMERQSVHPDGYWRLALEWGWSASLSLAAIMWWRGRAERLSGLATQTMDAPDRLLRGKRARRLVLR
jgi:hypothetical protein